MGKRKVIDNPDHYIADAAGMERENIYGWQVTAGKTVVELRDGTRGIIKHWHGGHFVLDNGAHGFRDDVVSFKQSTESFGTPRRSIMYCYDPTCVNKPTHHLWDGDDHISVCEEHIDTYQRPQDEVEPIYE